MFCKPNRKVMLFIDIIITLPIILELSKFGFSAQYQIYCSGNGARD